MAEEILAQKGFRELLQERADAVTPWMEKFLAVDYCKDSEQKYQICYSGVEKVLPDYRVEPGFDLDG